jgi:hypothetical protein
MKSRTLFMLLGASVLLQTSAALAQNNCSDGYISCVSTCVQGKAAQDPCIESCQSKNNACWGIALNPAQASAAPEQQEQPAEPAPRKKSPKRAR